MTDHAGRMALGLLSGAAVGLVGSVSYGFGVWVRRHPTAALFALGVLVGCVVVLYVVGAFVEWVIF
jgi:hypothetical protein